MRQVRSESTPAQNSEMGKTRHSRDATIVSDSEVDSDLEILEKPGLTAMNQPKKGESRGDEDKNIHFERQEKDKGPNDLPPKRVKQYTSSGFTFRVDSHVNGQGEGLRIKGASGMGSNHNPGFGPQRQTRKLPARERAMDISTGENAAKTSSDSPPVIVESSDDEIRRLKAEKEELKKEVEQLQRYINSMGSVERDLKDRLQRAEANYAKQKREMEQADVFHRKLEKRISRMEAAEDENIRTSKERDALLEVRTRELSAAQQFLTTTDSCSGSDVINMVQQLNAEINQASAYMADLVEDLPKEQSTCLAWEACFPETNARRFVELNLGPDLVSFLQQKGPTIRQNTFPLQIGLQALLAGWAEYNVSLFCGGEARGVLEFLYANIRTSETQAVSAKWRAITSQKLQAFFDKPQKTCIRAAVLGLLAMVGWYADLQDKEAANRIEDSLSTIYELSMEIKIAIKQGVLSCDLDLVIYQKSVLFDSSFMINSEDNCGRTTASKLKGPQEMTLCTVGLGLKKSKAEPSEGGSYKIAQQLLLKPEVVLVSALRSLDIPDEDVKMIE